MDVRVYPSAERDSGTSFESIRLEDVDEITLLDAESHGPQPAEFVHEGSMSRLLVFPANTTAVLVERADG